MIEMPVNLTAQQRVELQNLVDGLFAPLTGFINESDFNSIINNGELSNGSAFPIPIVLDINEDAASKIHVGQDVPLAFEGRNLARIKVESLYRPNLAESAKMLFRTDSREHPGARRWLDRNPVFIGGPVQATTVWQKNRDPLHTLPNDLIQLKRERGWKTLCGFQTRNVPHLGHEALLRKALEKFDGLFVQPLVGPKKAGDFTPNAVIGAYRILIEKHLPKDRVHFGVLTTEMRYAGPKEAVFHAIIRRNFGCTHFIVGRDHAGVSSYYGPYEAQAEFSKYKHLGISVMPSPELQYCKDCKNVVEANHAENITFRNHRLEAISGTKMRKMLLSESPFDDTIMRRDVYDWCVTQNQNGRLFLE